MISQFIFAESSPPPDEYALRHLWMAPSDYTVMLSGSGSEELYMFDVCHSLRA